ncbi:hypothetical protein OG799_16510 [Micromonospora sp. NBC_00898]|uniref:hypothetical protein n=1 Tax=Micromonospora sp. NBC_00898 TaxID=2975981 RepID=UPI003863CDA3|nr:hypothetical protein OG799_16510 [Micromonospora sp. NBC_00898]
MTKEELVWHRPVHRYVCRHVPPGGIGVGNDAIMSSMSEDLHKLAAAELADLDLSDDAKA